MTAPAALAADLYARAAEDDAASIVRLTRRLVRTPSRGGLDDYTAAVDVVMRWLADRGVAARVLAETDGPPDAIVCAVDGDRPGPHYVLDACLDTAAFGDLDAWTYPPTSGTIADGWMYGRGTSDSKVAVAMFCHIAARMAKSSFPGRLTLLFDLDEHTGGFAGIRRYLREDDAADIDGVLIGYPGPDTVVVGGRGFYRARISVFGVADHSASKRPAVNAAGRAAELVRHLADGSPFLRPSGETFPLPPKVTVTSVTAGESGSWSVVPDVAIVEVDIRLTPWFTADDARAHLEDIAAQVDFDSPCPRSTTVTDATESWAPFQLPDDHPLPSALIAAARVSGLTPEPKVAGPSNIGNYLASHGIPATAGFGVRYRNLHGTDEAIELASIPAVQATYHRAVLALLNTQQDA